MSLDLVGSFCRLKNASDVTPLGGVGEAAGRPFDLTDYLSGEAIVARIRRSDQLMFSRHLHNLYVGV
jgi:hypothetical protein